MQIFTKDFAKGTSSISIFEGEVSLTEYIRGEYTPGEAA